MINDIPKEASVETYFHDRVQAMGGKCLKFVSPGTAGVADRLVLMPNGVSAFVELKRLGEEPVPLQAKFLRDVTKLGHIATWMYSREQVDLFLAKLQKLAVSRG